ncbi:MAG: leucine-rich repeat domain-containing protein [Candidatus Hermodarchaeota archaeon]
MSEEHQEFKCASCGLPLANIPTKKTNYSLLCPICTLNSTTEPKFDNIVYAVAIGYFINEKQIHDPKEALDRAYEFVMQLPYWQGKEHPSPSLTGLLDARMIASVSLNMNKLEYNKIRPDFFVSHSWHEKCDAELVEPLVVALKELGYRVWYDKDRWEEDTGKTTHWMEKGIEQARYCIPVLCQAYFSSTNCLFELKQILTKDEKQTHVFPIWWSDIDASFLSQEELGKEILEIMGIGWEEWQGNIEVLIQKLLKRVRTVEGLQEYNGVPLLANETRVLAQLESIIQEPIPALTRSSSSTADEKTIQPKFGFYHEDNQIIALFLENKGLKALPKSLRQCGALKILNLKDNPSVEIPTWVDPLQSLNLAQNQLKGLPNTIKNLANLEELDLSYNQLNNLPESFGNLENLKILNLRANKLNILPEAFGQLAGLINLNLSYNQLKFLPETFGQLAQLIKLELQVNQLRALPESFGQLKNLKNLDLSYNQLQSLPEGFKQLIELKKLVLSGNQLQALPESLCRLNNLQMLDLADNQLQTLPEAFGNLENLKILHLQGNILTTLPEAFEQLIQLAELKLQNNRLKVLPQSFYQLTNLQTLNLGGNKLTALSEALEQLTGLTNLDLSYNQLNALPETFGNLKNLQILDLKRNPLQSLPGTFKDLKKLKELYLWGIPIADSEEEQEKIKRLVPPGCIIE